MSTSAEPAFITTWGPALTALGYSFTSMAEIGAVPVIERRWTASWFAVAEPVRRGGGNTGVVRPQL